MAHPFPPALCCTQRGQLPAKLQEHFCNYLPQTKLFLRPKTNALMSLYSTRTRIQPPKKTVEQAGNLCLRGAAQEKRPGRDQAVFSLVSVTIFSLYQHKHTWTGHKYSCFSGRPSTTTWILQIDLNPGLPCIRVCVRACVQVGACACVCVCACLGNPNIWHKT